MAIFEIKAGKEEALTFLINIPHEVKGRRGGGRTFGSLKGTGDFCGHVEGD